MNSSRSMNVALAFSILLSACAGDQAHRNASALPSLPGGEIAGLCGDWQYQSIDTYVVENNVWNAKGINGYKQCVGMRRSATTGMDFAWDWSWPASNEVRAYPEIVYGLKPWAPKSTTPDLPRQVEVLKSLQTHFNYDMVRNGSGNLAFDLWLTSTATRPEGAANTPLRHELMIWLDNWGSLRPFGQYRETIRINNIDWELYTGTATWGPKPWQYIAYRATSPVAHHVSLDIKLFLDHLQARKIIDGQDWVASVELGNEIASGQGSTRIRAFSIAVE